MNDGPYRARQFGSARLDGPWFVLHEDQHGRSNPDKIECGGGTCGRQRAEMLASRMNEAWNAGRESTRRGRPPKPRPGPLD